MAPPNNPATARIAVVGHRDQREWVNTFHVAKPSGSLNIGDLNTIAGLMEAFVNNYRAVWPVAVVADLILVRKQDPSDPIGVDHPLSPPLAGQRTGNLAPANVSITLSERSNFYGRKYRGRFYAPGLSEADLTTDDRANSALVSLLSSVIAQYIATWTSSTFIPIIFHKFDNTYTQVTAGVIEAIIDSQRRRLPGRGR
jgi:hypothetical protein